MEPENAGISRGQNQLHVLPEDWGAAAAAITPLLDRVESGSETTQVLVVTHDAEAAAGISRRLGLVGAERGLRVVAATDARRAGRVLRAARAHVIIGAPSALLTLLQSTALKLDSIRLAVLAWVEDLQKIETAALETLMAEVPKEGARVVIANEITPAVEQLVERYARRARRMQDTASASSPVSLSFVTTSDFARPAALRRVLDAVDPETATVIARSDELRREVENVLRSLGYDGPSSAVRVGDTPGTEVELVVMYELPPTEEEFRRGAPPSGGTRMVALITPRQITALKRLAGGTVAPFSLPEAAVRARTREEGLREELREVLQGGQFSRELLAIESLLSEYDGAEVAAAALKLLESERAKPQTRIGTPSAQPMTRLFINVGEMDGVRTGDIVGAITNEAGLSKADLGRVDVRERGSTVEVATPVANTVIAKLHGVTIKGRRALVKVDEERPRRDRDGERPPRPPRSSADRPRRTGARGSSSERDPGGPRKR